MNAKIGQGLTQKHADMVQALCKDGATIIAELTPDKAHLWHMVSGISGEAGELLDAIKKYVIYNKPLDRPNVIEELGDLEFYMQGLREALLISRGTTLAMNLAKLSARYGEKYQYSNEKAIARADKQTELTEEEARTAETAEEARRMEGGHA